MEEIKHKRKGYAATMQRPDYDKVIDLKNSLGVGSLNETFARMARFCHANKEKFMKDSPKHLKA